MLRLVVVGVRDVNGSPLGGARLRVVHSSGRLIYEGQTRDGQDVVASEQYDPDEGGYLVAQATYPGAVTAQGRLITTTLISNKLTAAYQCVQLLPIPRKRQSTTF